MSGEGLRSERSEPRKRPERVEHGEGLRSEPRKTPEQVEHSFRHGPACVETPATSANLGPGFDSLGLALSLHDRLEAEVTGDGLTVDVAGEGAGQVALDETHLVVVAMRATFSALGVTPAGLALRCHNVVPHGRGLGSSASAIVGGIVLARALVTDGEQALDDDGILALATSIEGHPDNVAAALLGGLTIAWSDDGGGRAVRVDASARLVVFIPPAPVATSVARGLLPGQVPHADAAFNAGRAALLVAALTGRPDLLLEATSDRLHQRYRSTAMPDSWDFVNRLRTAGVAAVISGAGPTVLAFAETAKSQAGLASEVPEGWRVEELVVDHRGAHVLD